jgi:hypothetical protein
MITNNSIVIESKNIFLLRGKRNKNGSTRIELSNLFRVTYLIAISNIPR